MPESKRLGLLRGQLDIDVLESDSLLDLGRSVLQLPNVHTICRFRDDENPGTGEPRRSIFIDAD